MAELSLMIQDGRLLISDGALATSPDCCCIDCDCNGWLAEITLPNGADQSDINDAVSMAISDSAGSKDATGFQLATIVSCHGEDPFGKWEDAVKIFLHFRCCADASGSLAHCLDLPPGEPLPPGKTIIQIFIENMVVEWGIDYGLGYNDVWICDADNLKNEVGCEFSDPITNVTQVEYARSLADCCADPK